MIKPLRILKYLLKLLIKSPVKTAFLIVGILLLYPIYNLDYDKKEPRKVINTFKNGVEYCYVISGMTVVESDVEISIDKDYYTLDGKLILKSNTHKSRIYNEVESYYESPNLYLKFETKQKKRNNKLEEILQ